MKQLLLALGFLAIAHSSNAQEPASELRSYSVSPNGTVIPDSTEPFGLEVREGHLLELKDELKPSLSITPSRNRPVVISLSARSAQLQIMEGRQELHGIRTFYLPGPPIRGPVLQVCLIEIGDGRNREGDTHVLLLLDPDGERKPMSWQSRDGCGPWTHRVEVKHDQWETIATQGSPAASEKARGPYVLQVRVHIPQLWQLKMPANRSLHATVCSGA